ncbi:hypothetical protein ACOSP7_014445 [Xanthoceras sorbifolium]
MESANSFIFAAQSPLKTLIDDSWSSPNPTVELHVPFTSTKRAQSRTETEELHKSMPSFKTKLMNMATPKSWEGFGVSKGKLLIEQDDVQISEEPDGPAMYLSKGGVLRDHSKGWLGEFSMKRGSGSALEAELWGVYFGLKIVGEADVKKLQVETDSSLTVNLLHRGCISNILFSAWFRTALNS